MRRFAPPRVRGSGRAIRWAAAALILALVPAVEAGAAGSSASPAPYMRLTPPLSTPWTDSVSSVAPLPEYPRPQLERTRWASLNGRWQYEQGSAGQAPPFGQTLGQTILVPFAPESPLSGIGRTDQYGWYRRLFTVPAAWATGHVLLNFGAVSWHATVYVNGRLAGSHRGDFDAFTLDITNLLRRGENELVVGFADPVGAAGEPVGKQILGAAHGIFHTAVSGIWQTVWLEPVSAAHITALQLTPDLLHSELDVGASVTGRGRFIVQATALSGTHAVASASAPAGRALVLRIRRPREWWPWDPYLYGLRIELVPVPARGTHATPLDEVTSYFGMRSVSLGRVGGAVRILLNGRFVFEAGALDQGYWPDGLYTPPTDAAIRFDIAAAKQMGFDLLREHEKIQPDRWYYWADRLGLLVWQDMPSISTQSPAPTAGAETEFRSELARVVSQLRSHPSIVMWIPFNEGWGQFDPSGIAEEIKQLDPGSLVDADSGSANCCAAVESPDSDVRDTHLYTGPFAATPDYRASVIGEYGAVLPYPPAGHRWPGVLTSLGSPVLAWGPAPVEELLDAQYAALAQEMRTRGLSGAVFTELASYEQELGILTYDRRVFTIPTSILHSLNSTLITASRKSADLRPQPPAPPSDPSGAWSFNERKGATAADATAHRQTLTLQDGAGWTRGPDLRSGTRGAPAPTGALSIAEAGQTATSSQPVIDTSRSFTISVWLNARVAQESGTAISEPGPDGSSFSLGIQTTSRGRQVLAGLQAEHEPPVLGQATWWTFVVPAASNCTAEQCGVRANMRYDDGRDAPQPGRWHDLTAVYDTGTESIALYVDGVPEDVEHVFGIPPDRGPLTIGEGTGDYAPSDAFIGAIGELRTYARALTPGQVWQLYSAQTG